MYVHFFQVIAFVAAILGKTGTKADVFSKFVNGRTKGKQVVELSCVFLGTYKGTFGSTIRAGVRDFKPNLCTSYNYLSTQSYPYPHSCTFPPIYGSLIIIQKKFAGHEEDVA